MKLTLQRAAFAALAGFGLLNLVAASNPASAQKAQDTIRLAVNDPFNVLDSYAIGHEEANGFNRAVYQHLISYDEYKKQWVPVLAKSFKRIDEQTLEFELRDNIKFHNGNTFDASDVKATFDYITSPGSKVVFKDRFSWIKETEVLGPYKIRVHSTKAFSTDLGVLAYRARIYDGETLNALQEKTDYGRAGSGVGTGPYKIVSLDRNKGAAIERFDAFAGDKNYFKAPVRRVEALFIPDKQTRIAQLLTGGIDLMRNIGPDEAEDLKGNPNLGVTTTPSGVFVYVTFDAIGRSANKAMMDERVRKAFIMAVDRKLLVTKIIPGGDKAYLTKGICLPSVFGCTATTDPVGYDPAQAKKLLAEAGYPNGLDLTIHVFEPVKYIAEALAGEVRKVGIRASVESLTSSVYIKKRGDGEFTAFVGNYPTGTHPDMVTLWDFFFSDPRDYWKDDVINKIAAAGDTQFDDAKRAVSFAPALDRINEKAYIFPISEMPMMWAHNKDVVITPNALADSYPIVGDFAWKK